MSARYTSILSQLYHFVAFALRKPKMRLENGTLIVSVDVDVGSKDIGLRNKGKNDANVHGYLDEYSVGEIEEQAVPLLIGFFNDLEIPATFAIRGQLTEVDTPILKLLVESPIKHDIGSHGYYHRIFTNLSIKEAEYELNMISLGMKKLGIIPRSFVFPKNRVAYLSLLEEHGYKCYRGYGDFLSMDDGMYIKKRGKLYDIHPSLHIGYSANAILIKKIVDLSIKNRLPFHVWFHPWNLGETKESICKRISRVLSPMFKYAKSKEKAGVLRLETMVSAADRMERQNA